MLICLQSDIMKIITWYNLDEIYMQISLDLTCDTVNIRCNLESYLKNMGKFYFLDRLTYDISTHPRVVVHAPLFLTNATGFGTFLMDLNNFERGKISDGS